MLDTGVCFIDVARTAFYLSADKETMAQAALIFEAYQARNLQGERAGEPPELVNWRGRTKQMGKGRSQSRGRLFFCLLRGSGAAR